MTLFIVLLAVAAGTYLMRIAFVTLVPADRLPAGVRRHLDHLPPAVLAALAATALARQVATATTFPVQRVGAVVVAMVVAWRTSHLGLTLGAGVATAWLLSLVT